MGKKQKKHQWWSLELGALKLKVAVAVLVT